jgi:hypothetical protein
MRQTQGSVRYGDAHAPAVPSPDGEEGTRRSPQPTAALEERIEETMDRMQQDGHNHVERIAALEEYLTLVHTYEGETWFDAGAWSEDLADSYLALGRVDDAVRTISDATPVAMPRAQRPVCRRSGPARRNPAASGPERKGEHR